MDHDSLLALFRRIVLATTPLLAGGCGPDYGYCPPDQEITLPVGSVVTDAGVGDAGSPVDGGIDDLVARCQAAAANCLPLCAATLSKLKPAGANIKQCELVTGGTGLAVHVVYADYCLGGRRPEGLAVGTARGEPSPLGAWLAATAHLEAASIDAFAILAAEVEAHRGPTRLARAARAAARDERRHADAMGALAARHGAVPPAVEVARAPVRDVESIARENAVEGCVRETFAALVAWRQARAAGDPSIRAAMSAIARDETRHAALAWAVDDWTRALLTPAARRRVREARGEASARLLDEQAVAAPPALRAQAGLPAPDEGRFMAEMLRARLA